MKSNKAAITAPLLVAFILFLMPISEKLLQLTVTNEENIIISASAVQLFIFAVPVAFYCKVRNVDFIEHAKLRFAPLSTVPFIIASALTYFFTAIIILYLELNVFSLGSSVTAVNNASTAGAGSMLLSHVIIPAIAEELFFRSIILSEYSQYKGVCAVFISALFFAMIHFSFAQFPLYFILGIILATITYITNSSIPAIIIHLLNNLTVVFFGDWTNSFLKESSSSIILVFILVVAFMLSLAWFLSTLETLYEERSALFQNGTLKGSRFEKASHMARAGRVTKNNDNFVLKNTQVFLSPTFFVCILLFILITLDII